MVTVPVREVVEGFSAIERLTALLPVPLAPPVTVIQEALDVAFHEQFEAPTTFTPAVPPPFPTEAAVLLSEYVQGAADC